jgi:predicted metal-dependent phosphoesterase TrpH
MKLIDLHTHTTASDGRLSPAGLVDHACQCGVVLMAVTDHDTVDGVAAALQAARGRDIRVVPGIEFSIDYSPGTLHLLGLGIDHTMDELVAVARDLAAKRDSRALRMVEDLRGHGIDITIDEVMREARGGVTGKPHVARVLVARGYAADYSDVFTRYLEKGLPGYAPKEKISLEGAMKLIAASGGAAVLAHPASLYLDGPEAYDRCIAAMKDLGLAGIEGYADMHSPDDVSLFEALAARHGLLVTGGSDYHGDRDERMGHYNGKPIPCELYDSLREIL